MEQPHLDFALTLHRLLPGRDNLAWSPYSVASALGLAAAGARGRTYDELVAALAPGGNLEAHSRMLATSADPREAEVAVANTLWMRAGWHFLEDYQRRVTGWPGGASRTVDFFSDPDGSRVKINEDVEQTTRGLIRDLLAPGVIHPQVAAVIVNALFLKVAWLNPFEEGSTAAAAFHAPSGTREVPTMRQQESFPYAAAAGWRMVTLPTAGDVVVDVLLPDADGELTAEAVLALRKATRSVKVDIRLPRFRIEAAANLNEHLRRLGVAEAFDDQRADFTGVTDTGRIWIEQVVHKAVLRVDEQGFEGAAATAVVMRTVSMDLSEPLAFHVDRPFVLLVRHRRTGAIYFLARVVEP
jgi:serine protease inhibitor